MKFLSDRNGHRRDWVTPLGSYRLERGEPMEGRTRAETAQRYRQLADATEPYWPERAAELRDRADAVEKRND